PGPDGPEAGGGAAPPAAPPAALSRSPRDGAAPPAGAPPNWTTPANGALSVSASTVDFARSYAACACARWAAVSAAIARPMPASTCPATTGWPGVTRSAARVPSAGALSVATARAVTVADESTTSVTSARLALPTATPDGEAEHEAAASTTNPIAPSSTPRTARGVRVAAVRGEGNRTGPMVCGRRRRLGAGVSTG